MSKSTAWEDPRDSPYWETPAIVFSRAKVGGIPITQPAEGDVEAQDDILRWLKKNTSIPVHERLLKNERGREGRYNIKLARSIKPTLLDLIPELNKAKRMAAVRMVAKHLLELRRFTSDKMESVDDFPDGLRLPHRGEFPNMAGPDRHLRTDEEVWQHLSADLRKAGLSSGLLEMLRDLMPPCQPFVLTPAGFGPWDVYVERCEAGTATAGAVDPGLRITGISFLSLQYMPCWWWLARDSQATYGPFTRRWHPYMSRAIHDLAEELGPEYHGFEHAYRGTLFLFALNSCQACLVDTYPRAYLGDANMPTLEACAKLIQMYRQAWTSANEVLWKERLHRVSASKPFSMPPRLCDEKDDSDYPE